MTFEFNRDILIGRIGKWNSHLPYITVFNDTTDQGTRPEQLIQLTNRAFNVSYSLQFNCLKYLRCFYYYSEY